MTMWIRPAYYQRHAGLRNRPLPHRLNLSAAEGTSPPPANHAAWAVNPGAQMARVFALVTLTGGTSPSVTLRPWLRSPSGDTAGLVAAGSPITISGSARVFFDVPAEGDDVLVRLEAVSGAPTAVDVDLYIAWR